MQEEPVRRIAALHSPDSLFEDKLDEENSQALGPIHHNAFISYSFDFFVGLFQICYWSLRNLMKGGRLSLSETVCEC